MDANQIGIKTKKYEQLSSKFSKLNRLTQVDTKDQTSQRISNCRMRLEKFVKKVKAVGVSNKLIEEKQKELDKAIKELKNAEDEYKRKENGEDQKNQKLWQRIVSSFKSIIRSILSLFRTQIADEIKRVEEQKQKLRQEISLKLQLKDIITKEITQQKSSRDNLIQQIEEFEKVELPEIQTFLQKLANQSKLP